MESLQINLPDNVAKSLKEKADKLGVSVDDLIINSISEPHNSEESDSASELRKERDLLEGVMKTSVAAIVITDINGNIRFANQRAEDILSLHPVENKPYAYELPDWEITDHEGNPFPDHVFPYQQIMNTGEAAFEVEHALNGSNTKPRLLSINGAPVMDKKGHIIRLVFSIEDVTERIRDEEKFQHQKNQLSLLNRVVRHDIRNDAHAIQGLIYLLRDDYPDLGNEHLDPMDTTVNHIVILTENVRDLMKLTFEDRQLTTKKVDLGLSLDAEINKARSTFNHVKINVASNLDEDYFVKADEMLSSMFKNILFNAVQHNNQDQPEINVSVEEKGEEILVRFADNGPGFGDSLKQEIFAGDPRRMESAGSGIGLHLCHLLTTLYGGSIDIEDNDPQGAIINIRLQKDA